MECHWNYIVITCPTLSWASCIEREMDYLQRKGHISQDVKVLTVEDPAEKIGSGGATLNALVVVTEHLSAQHNYTVITADVLANARILILHHGRDYLYNACGKAFISLPLDHKSEKKSCLQGDGIVSNLEYLLQILKQISLGSPPGVWVCSTDMLLHSKSKNVHIPWEKAGDAVMFCVLADINYATGHGAVNIDSQGHVQDIIFCGDAHSISSFAKENGKVPLIAGIVFLSVPVAESLLSLHSISPLDSCTYMGLDSGADPIQVSLFFDILVAMATGISEEAFLSGKCGKTYNLKFGFSEERIKGMKRARTIVWKELSRYSLTAKILNDFNHLYWSEQHSARDHVRVLKHVNPFGEFHSFIRDGCSLPYNHMMINSFLTIKEDSNIGPDTVICHSLLECGKLYVEKECFLSNVRVSESQDMVLSLPERLVVLGFWCSTKSVLDGSGDYLTVVFGLDDYPMLSIDKPKSTFCNRPWREFFATSGVLPEDLWAESLAEEKKNLFNAKLYPHGSLNDVLWLAKDLNRESGHLERWKRRKRLSLAEIFSLLDHHEQFKFHREIYYKIALYKVSEILYKNKDVSLLPYFYTACAESYQKQFFQLFDSVTMSPEGQKPGILSRTLSCIADLLSTMAGKAGGLRSGPGNNKTWSLAFEFLKNGRIVEGMEVLRKERQKWLERPDHLMRAARHYDRAVQVLIQLAVSSVKEHIHLHSAPLPAPGIWVVAECPARIDLQGGWTDTPPICYELGGSVVNVAVQIDGQKPVGAQVCRREELVLVFSLGADELSPRIVIKEISDLMDFNQPNAQGALLKAAIICVEMIDITSEKSLQEQLFEKYNGGFELHTWSLLPQGSGLGTSSILSGAVIAVLWTVMGRSFDKQCILHAVLYLEQLLTTGGGWQDQVGGTMGGFNRGYSNPGLPIYINVEPLHIPDDFISLLNDHLLLLYTGKVRLAKNLLQNVIRNWYARDEVIVGCFRALLECSSRLAACLQKGDLEGIGVYMHKYWEQKKILAPGCEPESVRTLMKMLDDHCYGSLLVGAGGGGYMCILTRQSRASEQIRSIIQKQKGMEKVTVHSVTIDTMGLTVKIGDQKISL